MSIADKKKLKNTLAHSSCLTTVLIIICRYIYLLLKNTRVYTYLVFSFLFFYVKLNYIYILKLANKCSHNHYRPTKQGQTNSMSNNMLPNSLYSFILSHTRCSYTYLYIYVLFYK